MKSIRKIIVIFACIIAVHLASASVLLTTPYVVTGPSGVATFSAPNVTCTGYAWQWGVNGQPNYMSVTYSFGTVTKTGSTDTGFTVATNAPVMVNQLNMTTGTWILSLQGPGTITTVATGALSGPQLTAALSAFTGAQTALRDFADQFLVTGGSGLPASMGTQPDTW